jgi:hypothetical protein
MFAAVNDATKPGENDIPGGPGRAPSGEAGAVKAPRKVWDTGSLRELVAAVRRVERRQTIHEQVVLRVVDMLAIHNEKLDAILEAATREPGPSPLLGVLEEILETLRAQESLLAALPETLAETIRDEWPGELDAEGDRDTENDPNLVDPEVEPAGPGHFDNRTHERH